MPISRTIHIISWLKRVLSAVDSVVAIDLVMVEAVVFAIAIALLSHVICIRAFNNTGNCLQCACKC